jgi:hypothetical protein
LNNSDFEIRQATEPAINFYKSLGAVPMDEWTIFRVTGSALDRLAGGAL